MCEARDFDLPESFLRKLKQLTAPTEEQGVSVKLSPESAALARDIAEQTGCSVEVATAALAEEGVAALRSKGILF